ncbi:MAG: hypothetical protein ACPGVU_11680 [Limisphaerales bacterium]
MPLYLIDAHSKVAEYQENKDEYFLKPGVWEEIRDSYDRYFKNSPDDHYRRSFYAKWAIRCNQPSSARKVIDALGTNVVKSVFGNEREFEKEMAWLTMKTPRQSETGKQ